MYTLPHTCSIKVIYFPLMVFIINAWLNISVLFALVSILKNIWLFFDSLNIIQPVVQFNRRSQLTQSPTSEQKLAEDL